MMNMIRISHSSSMLAAVALFGLLSLAPACNRTKTPPAASKPEPSDTTTAQSGSKRYPFKGKVVSIDKQAGEANIDNEPIPNFMDSMVMAYKIKPAEQLNQLQPGDSVSGEVVVQGDDSWLENVTVSQHAAAKPGS
jgi:Cu/Ag efflux protein CusF